MASLQQRTAASFDKTGVDGRGRKDNSHLMSEILHPQVNLQNGRRSAVGLKSCCSAARVGGAGTETSQGRDTKVGSYAGC